jgi:hypothetical protein
LEDISSISTILKGKFIMKKSVLNLAIAVLMAATFSSTAFAQEATPTATPAPGRNLTCSNSTGSIVIGICGVKGCSAKVTLGSTPAKTYLTKRTKNADGSLRYATISGAASKCTIDIGALKFGSRLVTQASCAKTLKNSKCNIK